MKSPRNRRPRAPSSVLAALGTLQLGALGLLLRGDFMDSLPNYYLYIVTFISGVGIWPVIIFSLLILLMAWPVIIFSLLILPLAWPVIIFSLLILPLAWIAKGTIQAAEDSEEHESCSSNLHFGIVLNNKTHYASFLQISAFIGKEF